MSTGPTDFSSTPMPAQPAQPTPSGGSPEDWSFGNPRPRRRHAGQPPRAPKDPGSRPAAALAWIIAVLVIGTVIFLQQFAAAPAAERDPDALLPPDPTLEIMSQVMVKLEHMLEGMPGNTNQPGNTSDLDPLRDQMLQNLDASAFEPEDRLRLVPIEAELRGREVALDRLELVRIDADLYPWRSDVRRERFVEDADRFEALYIDDATPMDADTEQAFRERHAYYADLALARDLEDTHPDRAPLLAGGTRILTAAIVVITIVFGGGLIGLGLLITAIILVATGKITPRLPKPEPGGSVYFELLPLFAGLFLVAILAIGVVQASWIAAGNDPNDPMLWVIQATAQWAILPLVLLWPVFRGVPLSRAYPDLGLHRGAGVFKEILCGVAGYLAGMPLLIVAAIATLILGVIVQLITGSNEPPPTPAQDIASLFASGHTLAIAMTVSLVLLWAPILEEIVFRGGAFRHLHARMHWLLAAILTAAAFAFMHAGAIMTFPMLMTLAVVFSALRYWRGSLIAAITAHFCQNAMVTTMLLLVMPTLS
ncbi:MAG: type II CAAX endopeptidase family protein [Planctomycetota bacterium]